MGEQHLRGLKTAGAVRFQVGAPVDERRHVFVARLAEGEVWRLLEQERDVWIVGPPRLGKTTLAQRARKGWNGGASLQLDCRDVAGPNWAEDLAIGLAERLRVEPVDTRKSARATLASGLEALAVAKGPLLLVVDELNALEGRPEIVQALLGACADARASEEVAGRLRLLLVGTSELRDLVGSEGGNPLAGLDRVELADFERADLEVFEEAMKGVGSPGRWLDAIYGWVGGHPYLVQKLARAVWAGELGPAGEELDAEAVGARFEGYCLGLLGEGGKREPVLDLVDEDLAALDPRAQLDVLDLYARCLEAGELDVEADEVDLTVSRLRNVGLVRLERHPDRVTLRPRSRLFERAFDAEWVEMETAGLNRPHLVAARRWREGGGGAPELTTGGLAAALFWMDAHEGELSRLEAAYYAACQRLDRQRRRRRTLMLATAAFVAIVGLIGGVAYLGQLSAELEEARAQAVWDREQTRALVDQLIASTEAEPDGGVGRLTVERVTAHRAEARSWAEAQDPAPEGLRRLLRYEEAVNGLMDPLVEEIGRLGPRVALLELDVQARADRVADLEATVSAAGVGAASRGEQLERLQTQLGIARRARNAAQERLNVLREVCSATETARACATRLRADQTRLATAQARLATAQASLATAQASLATSQTTLTSIRELCSAANTATECASRLRASLIAARANLATLHEALQEQDVCSAGETATDCARQLRADAAPPPGAGQTDAGPDSD